MAGRARQPARGSRASDAPLAYERAASSERTSLDGLASPFGGRRAPKRRARGGDVSRLGGGGRSAPRSDCDDLGRTRRHGGPPRSDLPARSRVALAPRRPRDGPASHWSTPPVGRPGRSDLPEPAGGPQPL